MSIDKAQVLEVRGCNCTTKAAFVDISKLVDLEELTLIFSPIDEAGLAEVCKLSKLRYLDIHHSFETSPYCHS